MPTPRLPTRPPALTADERSEARVQAVMRPLIEWKKAVRAEAWRLAQEAGSSCCTAALYERAPHALIEQGVPPPDGYAPEHY